MYGWLIGGLTALDLGIKQVIEDQEDETAGSALREGVDQAV